MLHLKRIVAGGIGAALASLVAVTGSFAAPNEIERQIAGLELALRLYKDLEVRGGWPQVPPNLGEAERALVLKARLAAEGHFADSDSHGDIPLQAIRDFQQRHGLAVDGRVGRMTLAELNIPISFRIRQVQKSLFRWKSLPHPTDGPYVIVNTAALTLGVWAGREKHLEMNVVAGSLQNPTPIFSTGIVGITVNPSWTIPYSIASKEILPRLKKNPAYLAENDIVILGRENDPHGNLVDWRQVSRHAFPHQLRQAPGPRNPLGRLKFEMPNPYDVYLHDTPAKQAFSRFERWLSHGCIRLQNAAALAKTLQRFQPNPADTGSAAASGRTAYFPFATAVPVHVIYGTAFLDHDGRMNFRKDVYGWDSAIAMAEDGAARETECAGRSVRS